VLVEIVRVLCSTLAAVFAACSVREVEQQLVLCCMTVYVQNVRLDDEAVLERINVTEPGDLTTMTLTSTQQALLLGLWSVTDLSYSI